jgi:hypothetical protein
MFFYRVREFVNSDVPTTVVYTDIMTYDYGARKKKT